MRWTKAGQSPEMPWDWRNSLSSLPFLNDLGCVWVNHSWNWYGNTPHLGRNTSWYLKCGLWGNSVRLGLVSKGKLIAVGGWEAKHTRCFWPQAQRVFHSRVLCGCDKFLLAEGSMLGRCRQLPAAVLHPGQRCWWGSCPKAALCAPPCSWSLPQSGWNSLKSPGYFKSCCCY